MAAREAAGVLPSPAPSGVAGRRSVSVVLEPRGVVKLQGWTAATADDSAC